MQKEEIYEIRKKTAIPVVDGYVKFKKGDIVTIKILKVKK